METPAVNSGCPADVNDEDGGAAGGGGGWMGKERTVQRQSNRRD